MPEQWKLDFIAKIGEYAMEEMVRTHALGMPVLASYTIAQACLESGYGKSPAGGNYFGVKGKGSSFQTQEWDGSKYITINASFASYGSMEASVIGHSNFLMENSRYTRYGVFAAGKARDWHKACEALKAAGYATDPNYAEKLISIINIFNLSKYDREADAVIKAMETQATQIANLVKENANQADRIKALEEKASMKVPAYAAEAVKAAVKAGILSNPDDNSEDLYRLITMLYRAGVIKAK